MKWFKRFFPQHDENNEALAAKIEADIDHKAALERLADAKEQSAILEQINVRNHFSESLTKTFRGQGAT